MDIAPSRGTQPIEQFGRFAKLPHRGRWRCALLLLGTMIKVESGLASPPELHNDRGLPKESGGHLGLAHLDRQRGFGGGFGAVEPGVHATQRTWQPPVA